MAAKTQIIQEIADHVKKCGGSYSQWYCGIAADAQARLFNDHNVDRQKGAWIYRACKSRISLRFMRATDWGR